jgi:hypothetical protein
MHSELFVTPGTVAFDESNPDQGDGERDRYGDKIQKKMGSSQGRFL